MTLGFAKVPLKGEQAILEKLFKNTCNFVWFYFFFFFFLFLKDWK